MAERPIFVPASEATELVSEIFFPIEWHPGFAPIQKEKNVAALHAAAAAGFSPLLEISSKSKKTVGQHLSAFHLKVRSAHNGEVFLECAFQGSKVFEQGGPFKDLYGQEPWQAKRDPRLRQSGPLTGFQFDDHWFPLEPKTAFYDWLYVNSIYPHRDWCRKLNGYAGFTDIEFHPRRSINCQARSCALFLTLMKRGLLDEAVESPDNFIRVISGYDYRPQLREDGNIGAGLFAGHP
jgi:hypothetical protein